MAPVCTACRLLSILSARFVVLMCFMLVILQNVSSLLTYDRQTLLDIKNITEEQFHDVQSGSQFASTLMTIPDYLRGQLVICHEESVAKDEGDVAALQ